MAFDLKKFLNEDSQKETKSDWKPVRINVNKLHPAAGKENFYHINDTKVEELARTIELVGIQQYPVVKQIENTDEYEIIAGHRRRLAILKLLEEGKTEYELIPCKVESTTDSIKNELILIFTNSTQRERTDYEKMQEIERVNELLTEYQKNNDLTGRKQNIIAEILGTSKTKVGTLKNISHNLTEPFKDEFAAGNINTSTANEIAGLNEESQQSLYKTYKDTGSLIAKEVKGFKRMDEQLEKLTDISEGQNDLKEMSKQYANEHTVSVPEAAHIITQRQQEQQEVINNLSISDKSDENNLHMHALRTIKELATVSNYLTEDDIYILQDITIRCKERYRKNE